MSSRKSKKTDPRYAYGGLDRVIHERARLSVLTSLIVHADGLMFNELKELCALTDGNLNRHLQVLEESKLVTLSKSFDGARQVTRGRVTMLGRRRYLDYLSVLEQVVLDGTAARQTALQGGEGRARKP